MDMGAQVACMARAAEMKDDVMKGSDAKRRDEKGRVSILRRIIACVMGCDVPCFFCGI